MRTWKDLKHTLLNGRWPHQPLLIGLDFDGTLSPLVHKPALARLPADIRRLLRRLARGSGIGVAIVSGRSLEDITARVGMRGIYYSGNHGLEIRSPRAVWRHPKTAKASRDIRRLNGILSPALKSFPGTLIENKGPTLSIHYRGTASGKTAANTCGITSF
ncbi:MAG: trehalose-phosphatase [Elusimicrobia bacterium]|nr:trehalose-phosphatase [Elusimicrobiota bacterium]